MVVYGEVAGINMKIEILISLIIETFYWLMAISGGYDIEQSTVSCAILQRRNILRVLDVEGVK